MPFRTQPGKSAVVAGIAIGVVLIAGCGSDGGTGNGPPDSAELRPITEQPKPVAFGDLEDCRGAKPAIEGFRCGSIERPKFAGAPDRGTFKIRFAVRPPNDRDKPPKGTIFAAEGGPGYASTGTANAYVKLFGPLLDRRPLVLMDMRGTGRSSPIRCPDVQRGTAPDWVGLAECGRRLGEDFEAYNTGAAADDLDAIRRALGLGRIALYGDSYGTYLAQSYAFRHPDTLESLVLDGAYPVRGESPWYPSLITTGNRAFVTACEREPSCPPGAAGRLARMAELMRKRGMSVGALIDALAGSASGPPESYLAVERAGRQLLDGKPAAWRRLTLQERVAGRDRFSYSRPAELVFSCNDYPMIWDRDASEEERRAQLERSIRDYDERAFLPFTPREVAFSGNGYLECLTWPQPTELREPPIREGMEPTEAPVLVVNGELDDLTTPFEGGLVAEAFPSSERFIGRNAGHVDALYDPAGPSAREIRRFMRRTGGG